MSGKKGQKEIRGNVEEGTISAAIYSNSAIGFFGVAEERYAGKKLTYYGSFSLGEEYEAMNEHISATAMFEKAREFVDRLPLSELNRFSTQAIELRKKGQYSEAVKFLEAWMRRYDKAIQTSAEKEAISTNKFKLKNNFWVLHEIAANYFLLKDYDKAVGYIRQLLTAIENSHHPEINVNYYKFLGFQLLAMKELVQGGYAKALELLERLTSGSQFDLGESLVELDTVKNYLRVKAGRGAEALAKIDKTIATKKKDNILGSQLPYMVQKVSILLEMEKYAAVGSAVKAGIQETSGWGLLRADVTAFISAGEPVLYGQFFRMCEQYYNSTNWSQFREYLEMVIGQNLPSYVRDFDLPEAKTSAQPASGDMPAVAAAVAAVGLYTSPVMEEVKLAAPIPPSSLSSEQRTLADAKIKINELQALIEKEEKDDQRAELYIKKGKTFAEPLQDYEAALDNFNHAINCWNRLGQFKGEREAYMYLLCGLICSRAGEPKKGERYFQLALTASPDAVIVATQEKQSAELSGLQQKCVKLWEAAIGQGYVSAAFVTKSGSGAAQRQGQNAAAPLPLPPSVATNRHAFVAGLSHAAAAETGSNSISAKKA